MRLLAVPNWSFGRDRELLARASALLAERDLAVHYVASDPDHNRTVTAFSGASPEVCTAVMDLAALLLPATDLRSHQGVHPRIGALDVCPFVLLDSVPLSNALEATEKVAAALALRFNLPIYLYEKSEQGRHEADLPSLREGGFEALIGRDLRPDFGPRKAHPQWGVTVLGVRDFLVALNVNLHARDVAPARAIARTLRRLREEGDPRFLGVRALGLWLETPQLAQVSMNITLPDLTPIDPIVEHIHAEAAGFGVQPADTELIGVIRPRDLPGATRVPVMPEQVVD